MAPTRISRNTSALMAARTGRRPGRRGGQVYFRAIRFAVPAQQGGRGDNKRGPLRPGQQPGQGRQHRPLGWFQIRALDLATQHRDLMAKDKNLDLVRPLTTHAQHDQLQHLTQNR
jgi:hypothetical protein